MAKTTKKPKNRIGQMFGFLGLQSEFDRDHMPHTKRQIVSRIYQKDLLKNEY